GGRADGPAHLPACDRGYSAVTGRTRGRLMAVLSARIRNGPESCPEARVIMRSVGALNAEAVCCSRLRATGSRFRAARIVGLATEPNSVSAGGWERRSSSSFSGFVVAFCHRTTTAPHERAGERDQFDLAAD